VYVDGKLRTTLRGEGIVPEFLAILEEYVRTHYPTAQPALQAR
jgi:(E)-4-hydroxy-3-methylbut-2-enyl-diphosphate synthase